jgi:hypothetical protein
MSRPVSLAVVGALVLGGALVATAGPAEASPDHGQPIFGDTGVRRTTAQLEAAGRRHPDNSGRYLPMRGNGVMKSANPDALPTRVPARASSGPRVAVTNPSSFDGPALESQIVPPDTQGDVGPTQFFVTLNTRFKTYAKSTGTADGVVNVAPDTFFAPAMTPLPAPPNDCNFTSDPHVRYDRLSQRWFIVMIDVPGCAGSLANRIMIAVSDGSTVTAQTQWTFFHINAPSGKFADYPTLGIDASALYIGVNNFTTAGSFAGTDGYVVRKSSILGAGPIFSTRFGLVTSPGGAGPFTPQGVDDPYDADVHGHFIGVDNAAFSKLQIVTVNNPGGTPTVTTTPLNVATTAFPIPVPHAGNSGGSNGNLDALDDRLFAATMTADGHIWTAHNIGVNSSGVASGATRDASRWYEIDLATPGVAQSGTIFDGAASNPVSFWIPSVAVNGQGVMAIGGSASSALTHVDAWYAGRLPTDAAGTTDAPVRYTSTSASYNPSFDTGGSSGRRWGDYSLTRVDPQDNQTLWTIQEYVNATDSWGVKIARLRAPGPATPSGASAPVDKGLASTHVTLTGTSSGGTGWYDPGPGFAQRLQVSIGCGVVVNSVNVVSPTQLDLDLDTTGAAPGSCDVTTTNPDGQSATGNGVVVVADLRPDALIKLESDPAFVGDGVYNSTGAGQTVTISPAPNTQQEFAIQVQNDGTAQEDFTLSGPGDKPGYTVQYLDTDGTTDITSQVVAGTFDTGNIAVGDTSTYHLVISVGSSPPPGDTSWLVTASSAHDPSKVDAVGVTAHVVNFQPDALIKLSSSAGFTGGDVYNATGTGQTITAAKPQGSSQEFAIEVQNDGTDPDNFTLVGTGNQPAFTVHYFDGATDITSSVTAAGLAVGTLAPGAGKTFRLVVAVGASAPIGSTASWLVQATSGQDAAKMDAVRAAVKVVSYRPDALVKLSTARSYVGNNVYNLTGRNQTVTASTKRGTTRTFSLKVQNDGTAADTFRLRGPGSRTGFAVHYFAGTTDITRKVVAGTYVTATIGAGGSTTYRLVVAVSAKATIGATPSWLLQATSTHVSTRADAVKARVKVVAT